LEVVPSWLSGVVWASSLLYRFQPGFPLINRATLFFLINENGKSFASFQKKKKEKGQFQQMKVSKKSYILSRM
jgi:hypothetical protein